MHQQSSLDLQITLASCRNSKCWVG